MGSLQGLLWSWIFNLPGPSTEHLFHSFTTTYFIHQPNTKVPCPMTMVQQRSRPAIYWKCASDFKSKKSKTATNCRCCLVLSHRDPLHRYQLGEWLSDVIGWREFRKFYEIEQLFSGRNLGPIKRINSSLCCSCLLGWGMRKCPWAAGSFSGTAHLIPCCC